MQKVKKILIHLSVWLCTGYLLYELYPVYNLVDELQDGKKVTETFTTHPYNAIVLTICIAIFYYVNNYFFNRFFIQKARHAWLYLISIIVLFGAVSFLQYLMDSLLIDYVPFTEKYKNEGLKGYYVDTVGFTLTGVIFLNAAICSVGISFFKSWRADQKLKEQITEDKIRAENQLLKAQVNPHFLFNVLNTFFSLAQKHNAPEIEEGVATLSDMFRYALNNSHASRIPLTQEIDYIHSYVYLQRLRFEEGDDISICLDVARFSGNLKIHPMLLITFIENAFKHGISPNQKSHIHIEMKYEGQFMLRVSNSIGSTNRKEVSFGMGLKNVRDRLILLYPNNHELKQVIIDNTFLTELKIALE